MNPIVLISSPFHFDFNQATAFEGSVLTHSDVKPGMVMKAKITAVDDFGAIVQFHGGVKALCPVPHMSEFEIAKPRKKFRVLFQPLMFLVSSCVIIMFGFWSSCLSFEKYC